MTFKESLVNDLSNVFINTKEFADTHQIGMAAFITSKRSWIDYIFKDKVGKDDFSQLKMPLLAFKCPDS